MKRYGEEFTMTESLMDAVALYMDYDIREQVHMEIAPCTHDEFLKRYIELDNDFEEFLRSEFGIEL